MPSTTNFNDGAPEYGTWKASEGKQFNDWWGSSAQKQKAKETSAAWDALDDKKARKIQAQRRAQMKKSGRYGKVGSNHMSTKNKSGTGYNRSMFIAPDPESGYKSSHKDSGVRNREAANAAPQKGKYDNYTRTATTGKQTTARFELGGDTNTPINSNNTSSSRRDRLVSGDYGDLAKRVLNADGYLNADGTGPDGKRINWAKTGRPDYASEMRPGYKSSYAPGQSPYDLQKARAGRRVKERQERREKRKQRMAGEIFN